MFFKTQQLGRQHAYSGSNGKRELLFCSMTASHSVPQHKSCIHSSLWVLPPAVQNFRTERTTVIYLPSLESKVSVWFCKNMWHILLLKKIIAFCIAVQQITTNEVTSDGAISVCFCGAGVRNSLTGSFDEAQIRWQSRCHLGYIPFWSLKSSSKLSWLLSEFSSSRL